jgi:hypothetical protein
MHLILKHIICTLQIIKVLTVLPLLNKLCSTEKVNWIGALTSPWWKACSLRPLIICRL